MVSRQCRMDAGCGDWQLPSMDGAAILALAEFEKFTMKEFVAFKWRLGPGTGLRYGPHQSLAVVAGLLREVPYSPPVWPPVRPKRPRRKTREAGGDRWRRECRLPRARPRRIRRAVRLFGEQCGRRRAVFA